MSKLFPNYIIDLENGSVWSEKQKRYIGTFITKGGYHKCTVKDCHKNIYQSIHEIILAEGLQYPKHLWPIDENGNRFEVDHILPVRNGGTDVFKNLRLVSKKDNHNNSISKKNITEVQTNIISKSKAILQYNLKGELIKEWPSMNECHRNGFNKGSVYCCCKGLYKQYNGFVWKYKN